MINLEKSWLKILEGEFKKPYMKNIRYFLDKEIKSGKNIYPKSENIFNALNSTPFNDVKVVILGQDPYHGAGQANGLSFSVPEGIKQPPSLKNIFKEIHSDLGNDIPESGNLERWSKQGVLLLNAILSVEASKPASHSKIGWQNFTDKIIEQISNKREGVIFLLWGNFAKGKKELIDENKHYILEAPHPSPFSAYTGFFGCKHFSKTNEILKENGENMINW